MVIKMERYSRRKHWENVYRMLRKYGIKEAIGFHLLATVLRYPILTNLVTKDDCHRGLADHALNTLEELCENNKTIARCKGCFNILKKLRKGEI